MTSRVDAMAAFVSSRGATRGGPNDDRWDPRPQGVDSDSDGSDEEQSVSSEEVQPVYPIVHRVSMCSGAMSILDSTSALLVTMGAMLVLM